MKKLRKGIENQTIGLLPFLLFLGLNNFLPYLTTFIISVVACLICLALYRLMRGAELYQFILYPVAVTQVLFSVSLLFLDAEFLTRNSSLLFEIIFVVILAFTSIQRRTVMKRVRNVEITSDNQTFLKSSLGEFFYTVQIIKYLYAFHLFGVLLFLMQSEASRNAVYKVFLFDFAPLLIGAGIILYEQVRLSLLRGYLRNEVWLPVLNDSGKVIGRIAQSISAASSRKFYHPVVRVAVVYNGMLLLTKRSRDSVISPGGIDYPFKYYVRYKQGIEEAVYESMADNFKRENVSPRFLIRYKFENDLVKHQVSVYVIYLRTEEQFNNCRSIPGKLWTSKQIEENIGTGLFSEYFEKEFVYLQNTVLMVEQYCCQDNGEEVDI